MILIILKQFKHPFSIRKMHIKCVSVIFTCFKTSRCLLIKIKMKAKEKWLVEKWPQIFDRPWNLPKIVDNLMFLIIFG